MTNSALLNFRRLVLLLPFLCFGLAAMTGSARAQEITATPGTFELVEGGSMYFDGRPREGAPDIERYQWQIFSGEGGQLVGADQARVQFIAPRIKEDTRSFTLQLTMHYAAGKQASAQTRIRVHRKQGDVVYRSSPWRSGIGFGFGFFWGSWWPYPPVIVIPCPPPGGIIPPEDLEPIAVPFPEDPEFDVWATEHPEWVDIHDNSNSLPEAMFDMAEPWDTVDTGDVGGVGDMEELGDVVELAPVIEPAAAEAVEYEREVMPEPMDQYDDDSWGGGMDGGFDDF